MVTHVRLLLGLALLGACAPVGDEPGDGIGGLDDDLEPGLVSELPTAWGDYVVYVLIPDTFFDGSAANNFMKDAYHLPNASYSGGYLGGDFAGVTAKMSYLKSLGVNAVLLYPVLKNDSRDFFGFLAGGYRPRDFASFDPNLGTGTEFRSMVAAFHDPASNPMRVLVDMPLTMTGYEHPWWTRQASYPGYYRPWAASENLGTAPSNTVYGPVDNAWGMPVVNATQGMADGSSTYAALANASWNLVDRYGVDGFRYDSAHLLPTGFWVKYMADTRARYPTRPLTHLAEVYLEATKYSWQAWGDAFVDARGDPAFGDIRMNSTYDFGMIEHIRNVFGRSGDASVLATYDADMHAHFDAPEHLVASADNYDESFLDVVTDGQKTRRMLNAMTYLLTANRVPLIYQGDEYATKVGLPGSLFRSGLNGAYHVKFKRLVALRRSYPQLRGKTPMRFLVAAGTTLAYARTRDGRSVISVFNNATTSTTVSLPLAESGIPCATVSNLVAVGDTSNQLARGVLAVPLGALSSKVLLCK